MPLSTNQKIGAGVLAVVVFIVVVLYVTDSGDWSEWTLVGDAPTCGHGTKKYVKKCTIGSIARMLGKKCSELAGGDSKTEVYDLAPCPVVGRYIWLERVAASHEAATADDNTINLAEVNVIGANDRSLIDANTVATSGSMHNASHDALKLIDSKPATFAHTKAADDASDFSQQWFKIDLGSDRVIKSIELVNRIQGWKYKLSGMRLRIQNSAGVDVFAGPEITESNVPNVVYDKWQ